MDRIQKSELAKILLLLFFLALLFSTPFISSSMRSSYVYFLLNLLIVVLGVEAGFLSAVSKQKDERKLQASVVVSPINDAQQPVTVATGRATSSTDDIMRPEAKPSMIMDKPPSAARVGVSAKAERVKSTLKRCKSRPSLFFIGSLEPDCGEEEEEEEIVVVKKKMVEEVGELSKQELFMKAEMFIGNFYKQLKLQRENSWQKLHDLYHKAF